MRYSSPRRSCAPQRGPVTSLARDASGTGGRRGLLANLDPWLVGHQVRGLDVVGVCELVHDLEVAGIPRGAGARGQEVSHRALDHLGAAGRLRELVDLAEQVFRKCDRRLHLHHTKILPESTPAVEPRIGGSPRAVVNVSSQPRWSSFALRVIDRELSAARPLSRQRRALPRSGGDHDSVISHPASCLVSVGRARWPHRDE